MYQDAEKHGPQWAQANDPRITPIGKILRKLQLDELPQLLNILRGEMSFVGPRPERPEFVEELRQKIPFYDLRHLVKPGLTGWAQLNFRYGASIEDAREKLEYDLYYIKNRSLILDLAILLKTLSIILRGGTGR
jgi:lipopolysaccharide/colanic/teichoic acid biosynthesis glycosyltransferase